MHATQPKKPKMLKELTLLDRFLFDEVLEDRETYEAVLEIILGRSIRLKEAPQSEKELRTLPSLRGIRMDVWGQDEEDTVYNSEMQKRNTKNLPRRSRYYQAVLDSGLLVPGTVDFNQLSDACLITIAPFDLFGLGRCIYTFRMRCDEAPDLNLEDGAVRIFLNTRGTETEGVSQELLDFLGYIECTDERIADRSQSPRLKRLHQRVAAVKSNEASEVKYMQLWEELAYERLEGREEGLKDGKAEGLQAGRAEGLLAGRAEGLQAGRAEGLQAGKAEGLKTGIEAFIADNIEEGIPRDRILEKLQRRFNLDYEAAIQMLDK